MLNYIKLFVISVINGYMHAVDLKVNQFKQFHAYTTFDNNPVIISTHLMRLRTGWYIGKMDTAIALIQEKTIVVPDHWEELSEDLRTFFLWHEAGHIAHQHHVNSGLTTLQTLQQRINLLKQGKVQVEEVEADKYAADHIGVEACVTALQYLKSLHTDELATREVDLRIEMLYHGFVVV